MYTPGDSAFAASFARTNERAEMKTQGAKVSSTSFWFSETRAPLRSLPMGAKFGFRSSLERRATKVSSMAV